MGNIGKPRRRVIRVPATPIASRRRSRAPHRHQSRYGNRLGRATHTMSLVRVPRSFATQVAIGALGGAGGNIFSD